MDKPKHDSRLQPDKAGPTMGNEWWEIQEKVFTRWANTHLQKRGLELPMGGMLRGGLDDGIVLWELIAEISGMQDKMEKYNRAPKLRVMKCENQSFSLRFLTKEGIKIVNIGPEDIVDRKVKQILGLIWSLIMHFHIAKQTKEKQQINQKRAKQELIEWLNSVGIPCRNLDYDWVDGKFLCKLVNILRPGIIPPADITEDYLQNAEQAIEKAYDEFDIPKVIDASDMASENPDELVNMTYLSYFRDKWDELRNAPYGSLIGPNPRSTPAKKPCVIQLQTVNVHGPKDIQVTIKDTVKNQTFPSRGINIAKGDGDGVWNVEFTPKDVGQFSVDVVIGKHPAKGCPLIVNVTPAGSAKVIGPRHRTGIAKKPVTIALETENITPSDLQVTIKDSHGNEVPANVKANKDGTMNVSFIPDEQGQFNVDLSIPSGPVEGAPVTVDVQPAPSARLIGPPRRAATATKPFSFDLETVNLKPEDLQISISDDKSNKAKNFPLDVKDNKNGTFTVKFTPDKEGVLNVNLAIEGEPIDGAPLKVDVAPAPSAKLKGPSRRKATVNRPFSFDLDVINLKPEDLQVSVKDDGRPFPGKVNVKDNKDGTFSIGLTPTKAGELEINLQIDGKPIEGAPLHVDVEPEPWARLQGPSRRRAVAKKPFVFKMDVVNVLPSDLAITLSDGKSKKLNLPLQVADKTKNKDGVIEVSFTPPEDGEITVNIGLEGRPIEGAPLHVDVDPEPWARILGPSTRKAVANKPVSIDLETINLKPSDLAVNLSDKRTGKKFPGKVDVKDKGDGVFTVGFVPTEDGVLKLDLNIEGRPVEGAPVTIEVAPEPSAKLIGPSRRPATATKPFTFSLDTVNLKPEDLNVKIKDAKTGKPIKTVPDISQKGNKFDVTFTPEKEGVLTIDLDIAGKPVEGAPLTVDVAPAPWARIPKPNRRTGQAKKPFTFNIDVINLKPEDLQVNITDPKSGKNFPGKVKVADSGDGKFMVAFVPREPGVLNVDLAIEGAPVEGGPLVVDVEPEPWAKLRGPSRQNATAKKPFTFTLDTVNLKPDNLNLNIKDSKSGKPFKGPIDVKDHGDHIDVTFTPEKEGELAVDLDVEGRPVEGAPLMIDVAPAPFAKLKGPRRREATAKKPFNFDLEVVNVKPQDLAVKISDENGNVAKYPVNVKDNKNGTFTVGFTPEIDGELTVDLGIGDDEVQGAPLIVDVLPAPSASLQGPPRRNAIANRPFNFKLNTENLNPDDLAIKITDGKSGKPFKGPIKVVDNDGVFDVSFTPTEEGELKINMEIDGEPIDGSPLLVDVAPEPWAKLNNPGTRGTVGEPMKIEIDTVNVTPYDLDISVKDPVGKPVAHQVKDRGNGKFDLEFVPKRQGPTKIEVKLEGKPIEGSPLSLDVDPAPYARFLKPHEEPTAKKPFSVKGETVNVDTDDLVFTAKDQKGTKIPVKTVFNPNKDSFELKFVPKEPGTLTLEGLLSGNPIVGSPLQLNVLPPPSVSLLHPPKGPFKAGSPVEILLKPENAGPDDITVAIKDAKGNPVEYNITENPDDTIRLQFTPKNPGDYTVDVAVDGNPMDGSPFAIKVDPKWSPGLEDLFEDKYSLTPVSNLSKLSTNRPVVFHCVPLTKGKKVGVTTTSFAHKVTDKNDKAIPSTLKDIGNDVFQLEFVPPKVGKYIVDVKLYSAPIEHSPWPVVVTQEGTPEDDDEDEKEMKISFNVDKQATVGVPFTFEIQYQDAEPRLISCDVKDPLFNSLERRIEPSYGDKLTVTLIPKVPGEHKVFGFYGGNPLSGGAIPFFVSPASAAKLLGSQHRTDGHVNEPFTFQVSTINVKRNQLLVGVKDPDGRVCASLNIDPSGRDTITATFAPNKDAVIHPSGVSDGIYAMTFVPKKKGRYVGSVFLLPDKKHIENSPFTLEIGEPLYTDVSEGKTQAVHHASPSAVSKSSGGSAPSPMKPISAPSSSTASVQVRASPVSPRNNIGNSEGNLSPTKVQPIRVSAQLSTTAGAPGAIKAQPKKYATTDQVPTGTTAATAGPAKASVRARPVSMVVDTRAPYNIGNLSPVVDTRGKPTGNSYALIIGSSERQGQVGQTLHVEIATKNVVVGQLSVAVSDQFKSYGARISDNGDSTFTCSFTPSFSGNYSIEIFLDENAIGGSPVSFSAIDVPPSSPSAGPTARREFSRNATASSSTGRSEVPSLSKSKELEEVKTQRETKVRKERGASTNVGSQTYRETAVSDKPKKKKKVATTPGEEKPKKKTGTKKAGTTSTAKPKRTTRASQKIEQPPEEEFIEEEPEEDDEQDFDRNEDDDD